jgi:hypothetical protein
VRRALIATRCLARSAVRTVEPALAEQTHDWAFGLADQYGLLRLVSATRKAGHLCDTYRPVIDATASCNACSWQELRAETRREGATGPRVAGRIASRLYAH